jgi:hypothetical protein
MGNAMPADDSKKYATTKRYCWFVTTHNGTIIPTDPMTAWTSNTWRRSAQSMIDAGFFTQVDLMMLDGDSWVPYDQKRERDILVQEGILDANRGTDPVRTGVREGSNVNGK